MAGDGSVVRIGVLIDRPEVPGWQYTVLDRISSDPRFELAAIIENASPRPARGLIRRGRDWSLVPYHLADRVERAGSDRYYRRFAWPDAVAHPDESFDITSLPMTPEWIRVVPDTSPSGLIHRFSAGVLEQVRSLDLDVILRFGFNILRGDVLDAARHGIWSFHHADHMVNRGSPAGFWEVANRELTTGTMLQRLTDDLDNGVILRTASYITVRRSWNENRRRIYAKSTVLLLDALAELADTGAVSAGARHHERLLGLFDRPLYRAPEPRALVRGLAQIGRAVLTDLVTFKFFEHRWGLLVARGPLAGQSLRRLQRIEAPAGRFWADPFVVQRDGDTRIFFEDFDLAAGRGHIASGRLTREGLDDVQVAFAPDYHLSYPFVFEHRGELYCIPESFEARAVELWRCTRYPDQWRKERDLVAGVSAVDSTIFEHDGVWYLFTNLDRVGLGDHGDELHLYLTDDPVTGTWRPHPANPVLTDAFCSRMGGAVFRLADGRLVRPAQRGGWTYGSGLMFRQIDELTPTRYREHGVEEIGPRWMDRAVGLHHCHQGSEVSALDVLVREPRWRLRRRSA